MPYNGHPLWRKATEFIKLHSSLLGLNRWMIRERSWKILTCRRKRNRGPWISLNREWTSTELRRKSLRMLRSHSTGNSVQPDIVLSAITLTGMTGIILIIDKSNPLLKLKIRCISFQLYLLRGELLYLFPYEIDRSTPLQILIIFFKI